MIPALASLAHLAYALFLICVGGWGIFALTPELTQLYGLGAEDFTGTTGATLLNQFRFLKAIELSFGLFALVSRREILTGGLACTLFLAGVFLGAFARALSWGLDGTPLPLFQGFLAAEILVLILVWLNARLGRVRP